MSNPPPDTPPDPWADFETFKAARVSRSDALGALVRMVDTARAQVEARHADALAEVCTFSRDQGIEAAREYATLRAERDALREQVAMWNCSECGWHHAVDCSHKAERDAAQQEIARLSAWLVTAYRTCVDQREWCIEQALKGRPVTKVETS